MNSELERERFRDMKKIHILFMIVCICFSTFTGTGLRVSFAAEPKVMLTDYTVNPENVTPGDTFSLAVTLQNTATKKVKNMKVSILSEDGSIVPAKGAGTAYVAEVAAETAQEFTFDMKAIPGLAEKSYKLTVKTEYEDVNGNPYTVEDSVYVSVSLESRISITEVMTLDEVKIGDDAEIFAMVNNLGEGTIHNVTAIVEGKSVEPQSVYVGNIESGKSGTIDVLTKATAVTTAGAEGQCTLTVTYEDGQGVKHEEKKDITVMVQSSTYENLTVLKEETNKGSISKTVVVLIVVALLVVVLLVVKILKLRKKKKLLEDF